MEKIPVIAPQIMMARMRSLVKARNLIIGINFQKYYNIEQDQNYKDKRIELNEIAKNISINIKNDHDVSILTFDNHLMIWAIMKNVKTGSKKTDLK